jgi:hypothetical protein
MSLLDKLFRPKGEPKRGDAPEKAKPPSEADVLEEEVAEERDETALRGHPPPGTG